MGHGHPDFRPVLGGGPLITLTFDDGLLNTYEVAFPLMEKHGLKGVAFIATGILTGEVKTVRMDDARYMSLDQIRELYSEGWEIGSHSVTHRNLRTLDDGEVRRELVESKRFLLSEGFQVGSFAYPYGHHQYLPRHVFLASQNYSWCRTVVDHWSPSFPSERFELAGIPMNTSYTSKEEQGWAVYVFHLIRDPAAFEGWVKQIKGEVVRFADLPIP